MAETVERHGVAATYTDYGQLIAEGGPDAVVIAAPDDQHLEMTLAAIDRGLHVLCEKPLANNASDARRMLEAAGRRGVKHMVMFTWRWQPHYKLTKTMIDEGMLGRIYRAQFSFFGGFARDMVYQWRQDPARANGVLGDLGSHMIDLMRWHLGEIASVSADLGTSIPRERIAGHEAGSGNDSAHLALRLASGAHGIVDVSAVSAAADTLVRQIVHIEAQKATVELEHTFLRAGGCFHPGAGNGRRADPEPRSPGRVLGQLRSEQLSRHLWQGARRAARFHRGATREAAARSGFRHRRKGAGGC